MAVGLADPTPYYLELEDLTAEGVVPHVRATIYNAVGTVPVQLRRTCEGESQIVQGARETRVSDVGVILDWAVPIGREVTYTVFVGGEPMSSASVTVQSGTAWLQDPLNPAGAIPVGSTQIRKGSLLLDSKAIGTAKYGSEKTEVRVMGSRYPRIYAGQRSAAQDVQLSMWSDDEPTETALRNMVADAPVLLFRPLPRHRMLPAVVWLAADVSEEQITVRLGGDLTHWTMQGNLVQAVLQAAVSGFVTYADVQALLGGYTYGEVQQAAQSTLYLDWQKNPLIFTYL